MHVSEDKSALRVNQIRKYSMQIFRNIFCFESIFPSGWQEARIFHHQPKFS